MHPVKVKIFLQSGYMGRLNLYILKRALISIGGLVAFAIVVLLLERLLRIFEIVSNSTNPISYSSSMVINLLPYYLGMAVPMALLLGTIITIDRFSRSSELTAALGAGVSLAHITKPFVIIAVVLAGLSLFIEGYMQPVGRYNYRQVVHVVKQQSFAAALREGTFTEVGNTTFFAGTKASGSGIGPIFIYERVFQGETPKGLRITTAAEGKLIVREKTNEPVLQLSKGQAYQILESRQLNGDLGFESSALAGTSSDLGFRVRGDDEREMTSLELYKNRNGAVFTEISTNVNNAALHLRIGKSVLLLILPFIAVPFGLNYGRNPSSAGIFIGIVMLVSLQKALEFGQSLGANGVVPPWVGIWPTLAFVALFAGYIFRKSAFKMGQPPLTTVSFHINNFVSDAKKTMKQLWVRDRDHA